MTAKRRKLTRLPRTLITPEVSFAFELCKKLSTQCRCKPADPKVYWKTQECRSCSDWWDAQTTIHHELRLAPNFWPCLPDPNGPVSPGAIKLFEQLSAALSAE